MDGFNTRANQDVPQKHVVMKIHVMGFGLDETESLMAQIGGIVDIFQHRLSSCGIERVSIVEIENDRAERLVIEVCCYYLRKHSSRSVCFR